METGTMKKKEAAMEMVWGRRRAPPPEQDHEFERSRSAKAKNDPLSVYGNDSHATPCLFIGAQFSVMLFCILSLFF
jgi:hypothetical protein